MADREHFDQDKAGTDEAACPPAFRKMTLKEKVKRIKTELELDADLAMPQALAAACEELGIAKTGGLMQQADACLKQILGDVEEEPPQHEVLRPVDLAMASPEAEAAVPRLLPLAGDCPALAPDADVEVAVPASKKGIQLQALAELVTAAGPALEHVADRRVVTLLGKTGTGKSTLMHLIAGRRLRRGQHADVYNAEEPLQGFRISHQQRSETTSLRHFERAGSGTEAGVVYLDSAGYEDTRGAEVDIATSVSFQRVAIRCRSLRFVVLINAHSLQLDRGQGIRSVLNLVGTFVRDFRSCQRAFTFLFTHIDHLMAGPGEGQGVEKVKQTLAARLYSIYQGTS